MLSLDLQLRRGAFRRHVRIEEQARVVALAGPSGAGKTTVLNAIAGLGPARIRAYPHRRPRALRQRARNRPARPPAPDRLRVWDARLFPHLDVRRNLRYGRHGDAQARFGFDAVVELLGIGHLLARRTANLSGGEAQRVAIGRALLSQPAILLFDEPLTALDQARREELIPYLQRVRDEVRLPMLYVSHHPDEVRRLADAVHVFD
ncbi:ATP-binding cassette domain-containing protein [Pseudoxanthomonas sp. NC8]|nr:ATP-binding cassette domain-containing protein [Pseudoxanthomonas sp. NC8]